MLSPRMPFTGNLYLRKDALEQRAADLCSRVKGLQVISDGGEGWTHLTFTSRMPLEKDIRRDLPEYQYDFLLRPGRGSRFLLVANHDVAATLLDRAAIASQVYRPEIDVGRLVAELASKPGKYSMGAVFARIEGQGQALRSSSLYGGDLGESELFRRLLTEIMPFRVTLRDVVKRTEVFSIASRGEVAFTYSSAQSLHDVDSGLRFLSEREYLSWDSEEKDVDLR
jgi:hypothetical protein